MTSSLDAAVAARLPAAYAWLAKEPGPKILIEALKLFGTLETPGARSNPTILAWAKELGLDGAYSTDSIPWCGLFTAIVAKRAGFDPVANPLWARNWATFGTKADKASLGDVLVFARDGGGHVGLYVGEDAGAYHVLGGNQSDKVCVTRILKGRCIAVRRCAWRVDQPANVRPVRLAATGAVSKNEA